MIPQSFDGGWYFGREGEPCTTPVTLPHDAMIYETRSPACTAGLGYFPGGKYRYEKRWFPDASYGKQILEFEGVYGNTIVQINSKVAAAHVYGYTGFYVDIQPFLLYGQENLLEVLVDNSQQPNSRWYSGSGIYRNVRLWQGVKNALHPNGVKLKTLSIDPARVEVKVASQLNSLTEFLWHGKSVASVSGNGICTIESAQLWSAETPNLYQVRTTLFEDGQAVDTYVTDFGIRVLTWNAKNGLQVNGATVKLRGACIHHDNGVVGACAFADAEARKIRILKKAGFHAIRSAHNPCSRAMLDACDRLGMYVMDEAFDCWILPKNSMDYAKDFLACYQNDLTAMVERDHNHPSVIMYSMGNETPESAVEDGIELMASMRGIIRSIDDSRPITCGISITQNIDWQSGKSTKEKYMGGVEKKGKQADPAAMLKPWMLPMVNMTMSKILKKMEAPLETDVAEKAICEACRYLDIAGYNYGERKTEYDDQHNSDRIIVSSETHHPEIYENWRRILDNPRLVGDFMWTGWDYIGEAGVGALGYASRNSLGFDKPYPHLTGASGIIDITGFLRPEVYWTQMAWNMRTEPVIAVEPLEFSGEPYMMTYWNDTEAVSSWTWPGFEGKKATVKVYTPGERVKLYLNDRCIGRKKVKRNMAVFKTPYRPGVLKAVVYDEYGNMTQTSLTSASGEKRLLIQPEEAKLAADGQSLCYVNIAVTDENGIVYAAPEHEIAVEVSGVGTLQGLGSGAICTEDSFVSGKCHTFRGRALAVIRVANTPGQIKVTVSSKDMRQSVMLSVPV